MSQSPSSPPQKSSQAARIEQWIALAVLVVLIAGCYLVLQPFLSAVLWAIILCCTTWPVLIWGVAVVSSVDNVIKPLIISHGSNLPFVLVLLGVLGGVIAFGFIGVFLGPTLLAIGFALIQDWSEEKHKSTAT